MIYGAYGNANTDTVAYMDVGIRPNIVYLVNKSGQGPILLNFFLSVANSYPDILKHLQE